MTNSDLLLSGYNVSSEIRTKYFQILTIRNVYYLLYEQENKLKFDKSLVGFTYN